MDSVLRVPILVAGNAIYEIQIQRNVETLMGVPEDT